jgi:hypothetical protein
MCDLWSIIHFCFWAFVSSTVAAICEPPVWVHLIYTLVFGYAWEGFEYWASRKWPEKWSHRLETWQNAWIGDPISNLSGSLFGWFVVYYYRHLGG